MVAHYIVFLGGSTLEGKKTKGSPQELEALGHHSQLDSVSYSVKGGWQHSLHHLLKRLNEVLNTVPGTDLGLSES